MLQLEADLGVWQKKDATAQSALDSCREGLNVEQKRFKELTKSLDDVSYCWWIHNF